MNYNKIILGLVIIFIIMIIAGFFILNPSVAKTDSKVIVTSNSTLNDGDTLSIYLSVLNNTPISNQTVNITIIDANGAQNRQVVTTDANGNGNLQLNGLTAGNYNISVSYGGNNKFNPCNTTQKLTMKEKEVESKVSSSSSGSSNSDSGYGSYINGEWVSMSESEYANRYPALYHEKSLQEGRYDKYHPDMYEVDAQNGRI
ncbi:Ig-like domain-containing protein [Methanobrevibacter sp.]|uniref:Ig-like domain-containing protein n=1 Tax=Methanobrevibacter sp. TaxID=66852 RepID=UPI0025E5F805|nr:Ig-like domain-containing protein [Methanobrevibacter sp.]